MKFSLLRRYALVRRIPAFSKLSWLDVQKVAFYGTIVEYKKGDIIRTQGDPADGLYCLLSGRIRAYILDGGRKTNVEFFRRGMYFGIVSLLTGERHSMTFEALNDSVILHFEKVVFNKLIHSIPQLGLEFSHALSQRIRRRLTQKEQSSESSIISIYSPMRGAGSSTFAANFSLALTRESRQGVIMVNFDASANPGLSPSGGDLKITTPRWKKSGVPLATVFNDPAAVSRYISTGGSNTHFLNVNFDPQDPEAVDLISHFVTALALDYRFVVVDLPTEMDSRVLKTLSQSDLILLVANASREEDCQMARQVIYKLEEELKENFKQENILLLISGKEAVTTFTIDDINKRVDFDVCARLPHIDDGQLGQTLVTDEIDVTLPQAQSPFARAVTSFARKVSGVQIGLVLGGGAALGIAHIGVLRVLEREKIPVDIVVGSSMGALIGSLWATGQDAKGIERLAREFRHRRSMWKLFDPVLPVSGIIGGRMIKKWLSDRHLGEKTFYDARLPLRIVAYDLSKRQEIVISSGSLVDAVRKSIAIPGLMEPIVENDKVIIDGGVLNPLPTNVLRKEGVRKIIAVNVLQSPDDISRGQALAIDQAQKDKEITFRQNPWAFLKTRVQGGAVKALTPNISDIIVRSLLASEYVLAEQSSELADVVIHPSLSDINWYELYRVDDLIRRGEEATEAVLPQIRSLCER